MKLTPEQICSHLVNEGLRETFQQYSIGRIRLLYTIGLIGIYMMKP